MKTILLADSSCDLLSVPGIDFASVPLSIRTDENSYTDNENLDIPNMLDELSAYQGRSYTSCPNVNDWLRCMGDADTIYIVVMTSALSGTYNSASAAAKLYLEAHPDARIKIFDTLSTGPEMRLLVDRISELVHSDCSFDEVCQQVAQYQKKTRLFFSLESLHNFVQNGRCSKLLASAAGILGIRILGTASQKGTLEPLEKCRGEKKVVSAFIKSIASAGFKNGKIYIAHVHNAKLAEELKAALEKHFGNITILVYQARGLCSYYAERGGILLSCECN